MTVDVTARTYMITGPEPEWWYRDLISCLQADVRFVAGSGRRRPAVRARRGLAVPAPARATSGPRSSTTRAPLPSPAGSTLVPRWPRTTNCTRAGGSPPTRTTSGGRSASRWPTTGSSSPRWTTSTCRSGPPTGTYTRPPRGGLRPGRGPRTRLRLGRDAAAFRGAVPIEAFLRSWGSANPTDVQDAFFSDSRIGRRCLDVRLDAPPRPADARTARRVTCAPTSRPSPRPPRPGRGSPGSDEFAGELLDRCRAGDAGALRELYPFGWAMQAQASLHGELLRRSRPRLGDPALAGAGRAVEAVAHAWTGLRFTGAHGLADPRAVSPDIAHHATVLRGTYARAVDAVGAAAARL